MESFLCLKRDEERGQGEDEERDEAYGRNEAGNLARQWRRLDELMYRQVLGGREERGRL